ncbi:unnamed protein product [Mytilus edulis]|uniref:HEPN domain-containing protein n=1 Tax=Mytilus edulis TaxID=6550 RepID=A0A8S3SK06_MYTED|nr:unnamed protein product [Mytilus edulis]
METEDLDSNTFQTGSERDKRVLPDTNEERFVHPPNEKLQNANKEIAWEWFTQAEYDLESGEALLRGINMKPCKGYYAVCSLCREAVEKGVKAVMYATNATVRSTHNFKDNVPKMMIVFLSDCDELSELIGTLEMMRYPCNNLIPGDRYTPNHATKALHLTEKILQHVSKTYL